MRRHAAGWCQGGDVAAGRAVGGLGAVRGSAWSSVSEICEHRSKKKKNFFGSADLSKRLLFALFNVLLQDNLQNLAGHQDPVSSTGPNQQTCVQKGCAEGAKTGFFGKSDFI